MPRKTIDDDDGDDDDDDDDDDDESRVIKLCITQGLTLEVKRVNKRL